MNGHSVNQVFAIAGAPDGTVWLASAKNGLIKVSNGKAKLVSIPNLPTDQEVSQILCARSGVLWVGFYNGAVAMLEGDRLTRFGPGNGLAAGIVQAFFEDVEGALWVGTSEGLSRFRHGQWTTWSRKLGIPQGGVHAIVDDSRGSLILLGARAVFRILPAPLKMSLDGSPQPLLITRIGSGESVVLQNRGTMAGPQVTKSADGRVWVGTNDGVVVFDTAKPRRSESGPPVFIERASLDGRALNTDPSQVAIFRGRELELEYTALDLSNPEGVRFLYRLKGLDPAWKDGGPQRQIRYANLRPGDYRFELRAANAGGTWNQEGAAWSFRVAPYFYQTLWFATLCGACAIALAWAVYKYRVERLSERFQVVLAERSRLARELHDTLLQGFSGVLFQLEAAMRQFDSEPETSRQRINRALIQADESMQEARQTITLMRSPRQDDFRFDEILTEAGEQLTSGTSIAFESVTSGQPELLPYDVQWNLYALSREAIHNAIKHAQPEKITLRMSYQPRLFRVVVEDNGIGFDGSVRGGPKNRFGLLSMRERATHIGAEFAIRSEPGSGTRIEVAVRVRKSSFS
jgi:signal transduction histidine kinase